MGAMPLGAWPPAEVAGFAERRGYIIEGCGPLDWTDWYGLRRLGPEV